MSGPTYQYLPNPGAWPTKPVTPLDTLDKTASSAAATQASMAAANAPLPIMYGQVRVGALIAYVLSYQGDLVILAVWGHGEVDSFVDLQIDDKDLVSGVTYTHYTGTAGQTADPLLIAAFAAQTPPVAYTDALAGICYSVVRCPAGTSSGFPRLNAVIKGLKVYDPRFDSTNGGVGPHRLATPSTWTWTDNPAVCTADFITNAPYGMGRTVDWASVAATANANDVLCGTAPNQEKMRTLNLVMDNVQLCTDWLATLATYAGCWTPQYNGGYKLIPDIAGSPVADYDHSNGNIASLSNAKLNGVKDIPTVLTVTYTDPTVTPYASRSVTVPTVEPAIRRDSAVSLPGVNRYSQAYREATERLNKLTLGNLSFDLGLFDEAVVHEVGDIITVTHPLGFSAIQMRIMGITGQSGRFTLNLVRYDPAVYFSGVVSAPTLAYTSLPSPTAPPALSGLTLIEEVFQQQDGTWASRIKATWNAATYAFLKYYRVEFYKSSGMVLVDSQSIDQQASPQYKSPAVADIASGVLVNYTVRVQAISSIGAGGAWSSATLTPAGKALLPSNVPTLTGFEVGGEVRLTIGASTDLDMAGYEIRYGPVGCSWALSSTVKFVDFVNAASGVGGYCIFKDAPAGTWDFLVCARDSIGQYSPTPARITIVVTLDVNSFLVNNHSYTSPTLTYATKFNLGRTDGIDRFVSDDGVAFGTKFPNPIGTYASLLQTAQASTWLSETYDFGLALTGNWNATVGGVTAAGAITQYLETSPDSVTWTQYSTLSAKTTARFARVRVTAAAASAFLLTVPTVSVRIDAIPREESGTSTSAASGPVAIGLANAYTAVQNVSVAPIGTTSLSWTVDKIVASSLPNYAARWNLEFNGTSNYVTVTTYAAIQIVTCTLEALVRLISIPAANSLIAEYQAPQANPTRESWGLIVLNPNGAVRMQIGRGGVLASIDDTLNICDSAWHRVTMTLDATTASLYIDGVFRVSGAAGAGGTAPAGLFGIGARPPNPSSGASWTQFLASRIADVRVWNTQRSAAQIQANAFTVLTGLEAGLVGYWPLNDKVGTTAANLVAGGNAGTLTNSPLWKPFDGFDAYLFNTTTGAQFSNAFRWNFKGV